MIDSGVWLSSIKQTAKTLAKHQFALIIISEILVNAVLNHGNISARHIQTAKHQRNMCQICETTADLVSNQRKITKSYVQSAGKQKVKVEARKQSRILLCIHLWLFYLVP